MLTDVKMFSKELGTTHQNTDHGVLVPGPRRRDTSNALPTPCPRGGNAAGKLAFVRRRTGARGPTHVSTAHEEILECIAHPLVDVNESLATGALPEPMVRPIHQPNETNILCELVEALTHPEQYRLVERKGELFLSESSD